VDLQVKITPDMVFVYLPSVYLNVDFSEDDLNGFTGVFKLFLVVGVKFDDQGIQSASLYLKINFLIRPDNIPKILPIITTKPAYDAELLALILDLHVINLTIFICVFFVEEPVLVIKKVFLAKIRVRVGLTLVST